MRRVPVSQWEKAVIIAKFLSGEAVRVEVREIGQRVATHKFEPPVDLTEQEIFATLVMFFDGIGTEKVADTYLLVGAEN